MAHLHTLDRLITETWPDLSTEAALRVFEAVPWAERVAVPSTYAALQRGAAIEADAPALLFLPNADPDEPPVRTSHREFIAGVTRAANLFTELGVGPGDVVSLLLPLLPQSFFALYGAEGVGIANPVNPLLEPAQIADILRAAGTRVLVTLGPLADADAWAKVERLRGDVPSLRAVAAIGGGSGLGPDVIDFDAALARQPTDRLVCGRTIAAGDTAAYFHTGGTTGMPKLVRHTHANQVYQAWAVALILRMHPGVRMLFGLPLFHVGGALTQALTSLSAGGTVVVLSPAGWRNPKAVGNVWRLVERFRPEVLSSVPTVLGIALTIPAGDADLSSIRYVSGGGSAIPVPTAQAYQQRFQVPVIEVYGMTETSSVHTLSYPERELHIGSVGHAVPYSRVRIVQLDAEGHYLRDCATDEIGVVAMAGPGVFSGYLSESHNRGAFVEPGWVNSGDLGRLDEDGYLWITGRAKDLIIRGGHNIDPLPIEEVLFRHPAVALASVVGAPDAYAGELPVAFVQRKPGVVATADDILGFVREHSPERAATPVQLYFVDALPLTAVGKVFKPALRRDAAQRAVTRLLADLAPAGGSLEVDVGAHAVHGSVITVVATGVAEADRAMLATRLKERLDPLVLRHEISWR